MIPLSGNAPDLSHPQCDVQLQHLSGVAFIKLSKSQKKNRRSLLRSGGLTFVNQGLEDPF